MQDFVPLTIKATSGWIKFSQEIALLHLYQETYPMLQIDWLNLHEANAVSSLSLLSAATPAATEGGKCLRLSVALSSFSGTVDATVANRDSTSLRVKTGWSWFLVFPLMNELVFLLLFNLYRLSSTVFLTYTQEKRDLSTVIPCIYL